LATIVLGKKFLGALQGRPDLSSDCVTLITGSIPRVEVSIDGERPLIARVGRGSLADHRAQATSELSSLTGYKL
jgi:hypothetical protein